MNEIEVYKLEKGHVALGREIPSALRAKLISILEEHQGRFVWEGEALTHVARQIVMHKLSRFLELKIRWPML